MREKKEKADAERRERWRRIEALKLEEQEKMRVKRKEKPLFKRMEEDFTYNVVIPKMEEERNTLMKRKMISNPDFIPHRPQKDGYEHPVESPRTNRIESGTESIAAGGGGGGAMMIPPHPPAKSKFSLEGRWWSHIISLV